MTSDSTSASGESPKDASELPIVCLQTSISRYPLLFLIDSGSSVNLINDAVLQPGVKLNIPPVGISTLGGKRISLRGVARKVAVRKETATLGNANFMVTEVKMPNFDGILGAPFLNSVQAAIDYESKSMKIRNFHLKFVKTVRSTFCHCQVDQVVGHPTLQCFSNWMKSMNEDTVLLRASKTISFPAWHVGTLEITCPEEHVNQLLLVEPDSLPNSMLIGGAVVQPSKTGYVPVMNVTDHPIVVKKGSAVAWAARIADPRMIIGLEEEFTEDQYNGYEISVNRKHGATEEKVGSRATRERVGSEQQGLAHEKSLGAHEGGLARLGVAELAGKSVLGVSACEGKTLVEDAREESAGSLYARPEVRSVGLDSVKSSAVATSETGKRKRVGLE